MLQTGVVPLARRACDLERKPVEAQKIKISMGVLCPECEIKRFKSATSNHAIRINLIAVCEDK
jgi:hypothetical protein